MNEKKNDLRLMVFSWAPTLILEIFVLVFFVTFVTNKNLSGVILTIVIGAIFWCFGPMFFRFIFDKIKGQKVKNNFTKNAP